MSVIGSLETLKAGKTTGFIGYPRAYEVGATPETSLVHGVDQAGEPFTLELRIPSNFIEAAKKQTDISIPEIASLAETHRKARNPCFAGPENGPSQHLGGAFLAEQVKVVDASTNRYAASWLSILREDESAPAPISGIGYLEINGKMPSSLEAEEKRHKLIGLNEAYLKAIAEKPDADQIMGMDLLDFTELRNQLALDLYALQQQWFIGVNVQYGKIELLDLNNEVKSRGLIQDLISANSVSGMYGGAILRPVQVDGDRRIVIVDSVRRLNHQYDYKKREIPPVDNLLKEFLEKGGTGWMRAMKAKGYDVEVIPCQRVNCGKVSNEKYAKEMRKGFSKQLKAFVDTRFHHAPYVNFAMQNGYLATPIAMRNAETRKSEFGDNVLLSSIHSFGKAIGNALELDKEGKSTLQLSSLPVPVVKANSARRTSTPGNEHS